MFAPQNPQNFESPGISLAHFGQATPLTEVGSPHLGQNRAKSAAERNGLTAAEEDLTAYFQSMAEGSRMPADRLRARYEKEGRLDDVRDLIARKKVLGLLLSQASVTLIEAEPVPAEEG